MEFPYRKMLLKKIRNVSIIEPRIDEVNGATYHILFLNLSNIFTSRFCAIMNAIAEPIAILIDIISLKFVETNNVKIIPIKNPIRTTYREIFFPKALFAKSVIKKVIG